ncbi:hypothetical protein [Treponema parvum]|uniref:hypothetical protein n=1 Tax=Treponema parvum TaxID=138851 RepID=UPI001AEBFEC8|nr:hypothetical protein [Treponema parvum]QTQ16580.1 hypothetical protein HXT04_07695 [Treponema parvum]
MIFHAVFNGGKSFQLFHDASGYGLGGIIGLNVTPMENLYLGLQKLQTIISKLADYNKVQAQREPNA